MPLAAKGAVLAAATMLASPYLYLYDATLLAVPFLWLMNQGADRRLLALLWLAALLGVAQNWVLTQLPSPMPLVSLTLLWLCVRNALPRRATPALAAA